MTTTLEDIRDWFDRGVEQEATHMIVVCDSFSYDDYPVFVRPEDDVREIETKYNGKSMQTVMEVYNLSMDREEQLKRGRVFNY